MMNRILSFLSPYIPSALAVKGISKIDPRIGKFIAGATAAGYGTDKALSFLRDQLSGSNTESNQAEKGRLQQRTGQGIARPDERAALQSIEQSEAPAKVVGNAVKIGGTLAGGALGGLGAAALGAATEATPQAETQQPEPSQQPGGFKEFLNQNPELGAFLDGLIKQGIDPVKAAAQAKAKRKFKPIIDQIESSIGQSFEDLIAQLFQGSGQPQNKGNATQGQPQQSSKLTAFMQALQEYQKLMSGGQGG